MSAEDVERYFRKLLKRAKHVTDHDDLAQILRGFPEKDRRRVFSEIQSLLVFKAEYPSAEHFRVANLSAHEYKAENSR